MQESRSEGTTVAARHHRPVAVLLRRLLLASSVLVPAATCPLEAQTCLGFTGTGFVGASGAIRSESSQTMTGFGASGGLKIGRVAAVASYLRFSGADEFDQQSEFQNVRATIGYEAITSSLSLCPVVTFGSEGVTSRKFRFIPHRSEPFLGGGLALGRRFALADSGPTVIPSLIVTAESHRFERIFEGDILIRRSGMDVLLRGGVTLEIGRFFVRPYLALVAADNGWLTAGARFGLRF